MSVSHVFLPVAFRQWHCFPCFRVTAARQAYVLGVRTLFRNSYIHVTVLSLLEFVGMVHVHRIIIYIDLRFQSQECTHIQQFHV